ncbi:MAG: hypothetical protein V4481_04970 [Patescibacteria group bacterium]
MKTNRRLAQKLLAADNAEIGLFFELDRLIRALKVGVTLACIFSAELLIGMYIAARLLVLMGTAGACTFFIVVLWCWLAVGDKKFTSSKHKRKQHLNWEKRFIKAFGRSGRKALRAQRVDAAHQIVNDAIIRAIVATLKSRNEASKERSRSNIDKMWDVANERSLVSSYSKLFKHANEQIVKR